MITYDVYEGGKRIMSDVSSVEVSRQLGCSQSWVTKAARRDTTFCGKYRVTRYQQSYGTHQGEKDEVIVYVPGKHYKDYKLGMNVEIRLDSMDDDGKMRGIKEWYTFTVFQITHAGVALYRKGKLSRHRINTFYSWWDLWHMQQIGDLKRGE